MWNSGSTQITRSIASRSARDDLRVCHAGGEHQGADDQSQHEEQNFHA